MADLKVWRSHKVEIRTSALGGQGIFATRRIEPGEVVAVKAGHVIHADEVDDVTQAAGDYTLQISDDLFLGPRTTEEIDDLVVMINHSCDANVGFEGVSYVAIRTIEPDEEICHDYAMARTLPYEMTCLCGTTACRGTVTHDDWKLPELHERYGRFFMPHILRRIDAGG